jgi:alkanesulfonate monooxygenase SsuD/methylene tetrahydromethanopterin reductase-like flavin-dependent oxidoreductase (luciferase family)
MKIGLTLPHLGSIARRENIIRLAVDAEAEGFDSLWVAERLLWPLNPQTPYQPTPDDSLPTFYQNVFDPSGDAHLCGCKYRENCPWNVCNRHVLP